MRKLTLILLIFIAVPIYIWDIFLLGGKEFSKDENVNKINNSNFTINDFLLFSGTVVFSDSGRDPFSLSAETKKLEIKNTNLTKPKIEKLTTISNFIKNQPVVVPQITITGIMWNPSNPIAMITLPNGESVTTKIGQIYGEITIKKIEKNRIQITFKNKEFWIDR